MIPLKDNIPTLKYPYMTVGIIALNVVVFIITYVLGLGDSPFFLRMSLIPYNFITLGRITDSSPLLAGASLFTSQFIHGGFLHIGGNMLFLWIFGNNVEDKLGSFKFIVFYLLCGAIAGISQIIPDPASRVPMIGASGAIAGVMGAYLLEFPRARVLTLIWILFFIRLIWLPAFFIILYWIALQVFFQLTAGNQMGGVAYMAHIGGFIAGLILIKLFLLFGSRKTTLWNEN